MLVRVSAGSALTLGLSEGSIHVKPTTAYLLTHHQGRCRANCLFCSQARMSRSRSDLLSRVDWPTFPLRNVVEALVRTRESVARICVQAVNYANVVTDILSIVSQILSNIDIGVSVSCQPVDREDLERLYSVGVERVSIPLDTATPDLFSMIKGQMAEGPYTWEDHMEALHEALSIFGPGRVTTHLIVGLGETDRDIVSLVQGLVDLGVCPALFTFTPIRGTSLENRPPPALHRYRLIQTARFLLVNKLRRQVNMLFDSSGSLVDLGTSRKELRQIVETGLPYQTSGCPNCNRPFYNEKLSGPIYNYPRPMTTAEIEETTRILEGFCRD